MATAHLADENVSGNAVLSLPLPDLIEIDRAGQVPHGLISCRWSVAVYCYCHAGRIVLVSANAQCK
jgi:hypothetical protein